MSVLAVTGDMHAGFTRKTRRVHERFFAALREQAFDALVLPGDLATSSLRQLRHFLRFVRGAVPDRPILLVRGNHDLWEAPGPTGQSRRRHLRHQLGGRPNTLPGVLAFQEALCAELGLHHLERGPWLDPSGRLAVAGWDGWYGAQRTRTNDLRFLPAHVAGAPVDDWLRARAEGRFAAALAALQAHPERRRVAVTHMPCFAHPLLDERDLGDTGHLGRLRGHADLLLCAHAEDVEIDEDRGGIRVVCTGCAYDQPAYRLIEV